MFKKVFPFTTFGVLALTACIQGIFPPTPLLSTTGYNLDTPGNPIAIAVEPNGRKNVLWLERGEGVGEVGKLIFWRTHFGEPTGTASLDVNYAAAPDIAVTDSGVAYLAWYRSNAPSRTFHYAAMPVGSTSITPNTLYSGDLYSTALHLRVIARGEVVYAVFPGYGCLYFQQLSPGAGSRKKVADYVVPNSSLENLQVSIDAADKLHVVWVEKDNIAGNYRIRYNSNATTTSSGDMNQDRAIGYSSPGESLAITNAGTPPNEKVYILKRFESGRIFVSSCLTNGCPLMTENEIHLSPSSWLISELRAVGIGSSVYVAFLAMNSSTSNSELFYISNLTANPAEQRITTSDYSKSDLNMVRVQGESFFLPIVGWRRYAPTSPYTLDDAYIWAPYYGTRKIFTSTSTARHQGSDLAANGEWVAGVWAAEYNGRLVPFLSGNAYQSNLPLVSK
ncbi:MAG: hypothetical protein N3D16_03320 [Anaerolineales bacterium]|nr:hypothetical protein [Anaerolineales bacterium]